MKMKKRRILSMLLALIMIFNSIPMPHFNAYADTLGEVVCDCGYEEYVQTGVGKTSPNDAYMNGHTPECAINNEPESPALNCGCKSEEHEPGCEFYEVPACEECGAEGGSHHTDCSMYEGPKCTCDKEDGTHYATCEFYTCPACGASEYHETCPEPETKVDATTPETNTGKGADVPECECGAEEGKPHEPTCPQYKAPTCEKCGAEEGKDHVATCPFYTCPDCGNGPWHETCPYDADIGKYAKFISEVESYPVCDASDITNSDSFVDILYDEFEENTIVKITDWYWNENTKALLYEIEFYSGGVKEESLEYWPANPWILQDYIDEEYEFDKSLEFVELCDICEKPGCQVTHKYCETCEKYDCGLTHKKCEICDEMNCHALHFYCSICEEYDCGLAHLYCTVCEIYDCVKEHVCCSNCGEYDCGLEHEDEEDLYKPATAPVIPDEPILTEGEDVSIVDEYGDPVTEDGLYLFEGMKSSISAWSDLEDQQDGGVSYQWQIRYDESKDLWTDIQGQTEKGILISPAMFLAVIEETGSAAIRCCMIIDGEEIFSRVIPVTIMDEPMMASYGLRSGSVPFAEDEGSEGEDLKKSYVVVQYVYGDGRTAASSDFAEVIPGTAIDHNYNLPVIPGYKATLENAGAHASIKDSVLTVTYAAGELIAGEYEQIKVVYKPDYVKYTIIHYWQNVGDDRYTEHEREVIDFYDSNLSDNDRAHKTGELIKDAHKSYPGFYNLLYETPTVAADASTVIEVYYDRYYYLMTFDLGENGYGVDPIYARYDDTLDLGTPTRAGYTFLGWKLSGIGDTIVSADMPTTMPAENQGYVAQWQSADITALTVMYWGENSNDDDYSIINTKQLMVKPGSTLQYVPCERLLHSHDAACYGINSAVASPGDHDIDMYKKMKPYAFESGYVYVTWKGNDRWTYLYLNDQWYSATESMYNFNKYTEKIDSYRATNGQMLNARKCKANLQLQCTKTEHTHGDSCCTCSTPYHGADESCGLWISLEDKIWTFERSDSVTVLPDGSSVLNVYFSRKEYTLRFYYAASVNKYSTNTRNDITYRVVGGTTYYFGSWGNSTTDEVPLLDRYFVDGRDKNNQTGEVAKKPTLKRTDHGYTEGTTSGANGYTYYYISFAAKYGANIYDMWPADVFNSVYCYDHDWDKSEYAFVSAWNGEHHVYYSQKNDNETIKGKYAVLDDNLLWDYDQFGAYAEVETDANGNEYNVVDFLCFWENGANVDWSYPGLFRYHIYVEPYEGMDTTGLASRTWNDEVYYYMEAYDTIDDSNVESQTYPEIEGFTQLADYFVKGSDGKADRNTFDFSKIQSNDTNLYMQAWDIYFYYDRTEYQLQFFNEIGVEKTEQVEFDRPLAAFASYTPSNPVDENGIPIYEAGSHRFAGWYDNPSFAGDPFDFTKTSMPAENIILYAKWEPVDYKVNYYLTRDSLTRGENIPVEMARLVQEYLAANPDKTAPTDVYTTVFAEDIVKNGSFIINLPVPNVFEGYEAIHPHAGYDFVGWFYLDGTKEKAFDPENMPVHQNLNLYAKWSADKLCVYNVYFALDVKNNKTGATGSDGIADVDGKGNIIYVADSVSGSGIAGRTYTFIAKGGEELYNLGESQNYQEGYFPTAGSHSITIDVADTNGTGTNSYTFLYQQKNAVPYTVKYLVKETGEPLFPEKVVADNKNVIVTENFQYKQGYMPDDYQITLIVTDDGNTENDVIIFYYTKDEQHALYVVNYYIQDLKEDLTHKGWSKYTDFQSTGDIGKSYSADALQIDGFTLSKTYTDDYNVTQKKNGMEGTALPSDVNALTVDNKLSGTLKEEGMELNFYYTRNLYPYEFRYMLNGTTTQLAEPGFGKAGYDTYVTGVAKEIVMDLDKDGINEEYRLEDPTEVTKDIHIIKDGDPLSYDYVVTEGQATVNVATFNYVRCTQSMTIEKVVTYSGAGSNQGSDQEFEFELSINESGYHKDRYEFEKYDVANETIVSTGEIAISVSEPKVLSFTLKAGQKITIKDLPTAGYVLEELNVPDNCYDTYSLSGSSSEPSKGQLAVTLGKENPIDIVVTNTYAPTSLTIKKVVTGTSETDTFLFHVSGEGVDIDVTVTTSMKDGVNSGSVTIKDLPFGTYTVTENVSWSWRYLLAGDNGKKVTLENTNSQGTVEFANSWKTGQWLNSTAYTDNNFTGPCAGVDNSNNASQASAITLNHIVALVTRRGVKEDEGEAYEEKYYS